MMCFFFFQAEDGIRDYKVTGVQRVLFRSVVAQTRAAQELAQANLVRWRALAVDSAVTAQEVDQMQAAFNEAVANSNSAEANLQRLVQLQAYERVVAPFAGVITARNVDPGALVGPAGGGGEAVPAGGGARAAGRVLPPPTPQPPAAGAAAPH